jgi:hypothetical protein
MAAASPTRLRIRAIVPAILISRALCASSLALMGAHINAVLCCSQSANGMHYIGFFELPPAAHRKELVSDCWQQQCRELYGTVHAQGSRFF